MMKRTLMLSIFKRTVWSVQPTGNEHSNRTNLNDMGDDVIDSTG